ncbi:MAG: hypothetical protein Q9181_002772 [Wetmoreana brouardii]
MSAAAKRTNEHGQQRSLHRGSRNVAAHFERVHLLTMGQHPAIHSDGKPCNDFLELLPPATYVPGTRRASFVDSRRPFSASRSTMPTPEEVKAVMTRSRSCSTSTVSSVSTSYEGDRNRFLQLVPETDE